MSTVPGHPEVGTGQHFQLADPAPKGIRGYTVPGYRHDYLGNRFVYVTISPRARGLSLGINLSPDRRCNFACVYCDVDRRQPLPNVPLDLDALSDELWHTLRRAQEGKLRVLPGYQHIPAELFRVQEVDLSGEGEPTLSPQFAEVIQVVLHLRALAPSPAFKIVVMTNGSGLDLPHVRQGLRKLTSRDEIWVKLDAGTQAHMNMINRSNQTLRKVLANIHRFARERPVVIQSLFPCLQNQGPSPLELDEYVCRLLELKNAGAGISLVQVYSAQQPTAHPQCRHLPLSSLAFIAQRVQDATGLNAQVF